MSCHFKITLGRKCVTNFDQWVECESQLLPDEISKLRLEEHWTSLWGEQNEICLANLELWIAGEPSATTPQTLCRVQRSHLEHCA